ncbi:MAG: ABC transporter permease [Prevotellaceae bacterium]|nr:ABC transporter permease [Prevotellaceae bacterium]
MTFAFFIARRYLFSPKRHGVINLISAISALGVALASMAMLCTLSVFNGFRNLVGGLYTTFDPPVEVRAASGKSFDGSSPEIVRARRLGGVEASSLVYSDNALILFMGKPTVVTLVGVDDQFTRVTDFERVLYGNGQFRLEAADVDYGIPGIGLAAMLGTTDYGSVEICAPRGGERINLANPVESFNAGNLSSAGVCFEIHQRKIDEAYMLCPLRFARELFEKPGQATSLAVRPKAGVSVDELKTRLRQTLGDGYRVEDRFEQQADMFRLMQVEKLLAYVFLTFILLVASFNIIGCVSMLIIEKREDIATLRHLGAREPTIRRIFLFESLLVSLSGALAGLALGAAACWAQSRYGLLRLGSAGDFIVEAYPVALEVRDAALVLLTVVVVSLASLWYPVRYLTRRSWR